jgi:hypothetical protein
LNDETKLSNAIALRTEVDLYIEIIGSVVLFMAVEIIIAPI